jgi:PTS system nitrogen regulatory IIA component
MNLKKILTTDCILLNLKSETKEEILAEMVDFLIHTGKIKNCQTALSVIMEREKKMSTGMQNGIAIPHGKTDEVKRLVAMVAIHRQGVDFSSIDGKPSHIFVMTLSPVKHTGPHIQFLAEISKLLSDTDLLEKVIQASTQEEILTLLTA